MCKWGLSQLTMKKKLIFLLLSLAFVGSAYANSIDGAFGYKLGQVVEDVEDFPNFHLRKEIVPKKPLPGNFSYALYTTLKDKKVYKISANDNKSILSVNDCTTSYKYKFGPYYKIMKLYEFRYGKFVKTVSKEGDWGRSVSKTYIPRIKWTSYNNSYTDGHREILIRCRISNFSTTSLEIIYIDSILEKIHEEEAENGLKEEEKEKEQKYIEDASEYDI